MSEQVVLTLVGTRPEAIKLAPVLRALAARPDRIRPVTVLTGQHTDLVEAFISLFGIRASHDLRLMQSEQTPLGLAQRLLERLDPILRDELPDMVLVQGDTTTAMAGALAGFYHNIPVGHVEAGLRTDDPRVPFPEEMNRRLISQLATLHFAATERNRDTLLAEGIAADHVFVTGNPVVDSLHAIVDRLSPSPRIADLLDAAAGSRLIVLTTHRRESFGSPMDLNLRTIREFVDLHRDVILAFPVHPNPHVKEVALQILAGSPRIHLLPPLDYFDFISLLSESWLIVSDSGGVQEEAPTLGKPLLILRENTERPEAVEAGIARLVGRGGTRLRTMLNDAYESGSWPAGVHRISNPFGDGKSGERIVDVAWSFLQRHGR